MLLHDAKAIRQLKAEQKQLVRKLRRRLAVLLWRERLAGAQATRERLRAEIEKTETALALAKLPTWARKAWETTK